jgi:tungstate transport system substrate-binding protein
MNNSLSLSAHARRVMLAALASVLTACATPATPAAPAATVAPAASAASGTLRLATTTSTQDSGLLDVLLPDFEKEAGVKVDVVAVGTGQALKLGEDGNVDVVLVHARSQEDAFMKAEHGTRREDVMYNDFVIIGPAADPAKIKGLSADAALKAIQTNQATFISRGDKSGTHSKELAIWKKAAIEPAGSWYQSAGQGMGAVLNIAGEQSAYTLSDRATYLTRKKAGLALEILVEGDSQLLNPYGVIAVNPAKNSAINNVLANRFIDWLTSPAVQTKIGAFGAAEFGQSLFVPNAKPK